MLGGTLYLVGREAKSGDLTDAVPCSMCKRTIINSGIKDVVMRNADGSFVIVDVDEWVKDDESLPEEMK